MTTIAPINITYGQYVINQSIVPYMRALPVIVRAVNLKPYKVANHWVDDVSVNQFAQPASILQANSGFAVNTMFHQEGLYCSNTHAYAQVLQYSGNAALHIDENFICLNLSPYGPLNSNSFTNADYAAGDIVYQSNNTPNVFANSFVGRVVNWAYTDGAIAILPEFGTVNVAAGGLILYKVGSTKLANVGNTVEGNRFPVNGTVKSTANVSKIFTVNTYNHLSGVVHTVAPSGLQIQVMANVNPNVISKTIYLAGGQGIGQYNKIISITSNNLLTLQNAWSSHSSNTFYGIGNPVVDGFGLLTSILRIPSDLNFKFQTGYRLITINDGVTYNDNGATMRATASFAALGSIAQSTATTPTVKTTPSLSPAANNVTAPASPTASQINNNQQTNIPAALADPLVQTFFTPKSNQKTDNGIFVSSVDLFFKSKPQVPSTPFPVVVHIVKTVNGYPTTEILGSSIVRCEDVQLADGVVLFPNTTIPSTKTKFTFIDPIYIAPSTEYGIVVYSESPDYLVWISQLGDRIINTTRLISTLPYIGVLYKAQNASAWNPIKNQSLMFQVNKCVFTTTPSTLQFQIKPAIQNTFVDQIILHSGDLTLTPTALQYGVKTVVANTYVQDTGFFAMDVNAPFSFGNDLNNSSALSNRRRLLEAGNANSMIVQIQMSTNDPDVSPMFHKERLSVLAITNHINAGGLRTNDITINTGGVHSNAANIIVTFDAPTGDGGVQATGNVVALSTTNVTAINIINSGSGYLISPSINIAEPGQTSNATATYNSEDKQSGGNSLARYVTRPITLADGFDAGDIVVYMNAVRPQGTDVNVYYKVLSATDTDSITAKNWKLMSKKFDIFSPDQKNAVALTFNTGTNVLGIPKGSVSYVENGVTYPLGGKFKTFAIKVVMNANDPTVPPVVQNIQIIAVPAG